MGTLSRELRHRRVQAVAVLVGLLLDDTLHLHVAVLAMERHLLFELGTHLRLRELDLLLDVFVCLNLQLGVDLSSDALAFLVKTEGLIVLQLLKFELLLEFVLHNLLLFHRLFTFSYLLGQLFFLRSDPESHVAATATGDDSFSDLEHHRVQFNLLDGGHLAIGPKLKFGWLVGGLEDFIFAV